jgi:hypothetical protein
VSGGLGATRTASLVALLLAAACNPHAGPPSGHPTGAQLVEFSCPAVDTDPRFEPIRDRLSIVPAAALAITVPQRNDPTFPIAAERAAIGDWNTVLSTCEAQAIATPRAAAPVPSSTPGPRNARCAPRWRAVR